MELMPVPPRVLSSCASLESAPVAPSLYTTWPVVPAAILLRAIAAAEFIFASVSELSITIAVKTPASKVKSIVEEIRNGTEN